MKYTQTELILIAARWEAMCEIVEGKEVCDFTLSFPEVRACQALKVSSDSMKASLNDTHRLDFLQNLLEKQEYTGKVILRDSHYNRGWRLHETSSEEAVSSVREAIDNYMEEFIEEGSKYEKPIRTTEEG